ncbi:transposase [Gemmatimonas sp.]|uniref:transposase n=1 Tax=Gemmatimonas sp. TaxID=1962908 RepID=UPI00333F9EF8
MPRSGPRKLYKYTDEFKQTAVRLSHQPGLQVKTVATALEIHRFMLSKWRKDVRDGLIGGRAVKAPPPGPAREIAQRQALEQRYAERQQEHDLIKEAMRCCSAQRAKRSPASTRMTHRSA